MTLLTVLAALGCGGQVGEETIVCKAVERIALAPGDATPLGFTADEVSAVVVGEHATAVTWADDQSTNATVSMSYGGGEIWYEDREWQDDGNNLAEIGSECGDGLTIEMTASLVTSDGRLAETWSVIFDAQAATGGRFSATPAELNGTLDPSAFAPDSDYDELGVFVEIAIDESGVDGYIFGQTSGTDGDIAFASNFDIGQIGAAEL